MSRKNQSGEELALLPSGYINVLQELKTQIRSAQHHAVLSVNRELINLYWTIGKAIAVRQKKGKWGQAVIERLAMDIQDEFPGITGFSARNIWRMKSFYLAWTSDVKKLPQAVAELDGKNLSQVVAQIPWGHNALILEKFQDPIERLWYAKMTVKNGWSRAVLAHQIESGLIERQGRALTNFKTTLPSPQSDLAAQLLKDPYNFDFLTLAEGAREKELELALVDKVQKFLIELGAGFAFVGRQVHIEVGNQDYYIYLLFYHLKLRCYIVVELKTAEFKPEYAGKMNFYLSAIDDLMRHPQDASSIGLILCKAKERIIVEYALRNTARPIGVAGYRLTRTLPRKYAGALPSIEELEREIARRPRP